MGLTVESTAAEICKVYTRETLNRGGWILLSVVYSKWLAQKEIEPIEKLPEWRKREYWNMSDKSWDKWKRINFCRGVYVYDLITNKFNQ